MMTVTAATKLFSLASSARVCPMAATRAFSSFARTLSSVLTARRSDTMHPLTALGRHLGRTGSLFVPIKAMVKLGLYRHKKLAEAESAEAGVDDEEEDYDIVCVILAQISLKLTVNHIGRYDASTPSSVHSKSSRSSRRSSARTVFSSASRWYALVPCFACVSVVMPFRSLMVVATHVGRM